MLQREIKGGRVWKCDKCGNVKINRPGRTTEFSHFHIYHISTSQTILFVYLNFTNHENCKNNFAR